MDLVIFVVALLARALAAPRWGVDSTDGIDSPEWQRRRDWPSSGGGSRVAAAAVLPPHASEGEDSTMIAMASDQSICAGCFGPFDPMARPVLLLDLVFHELCAP
jgi:hypothetical protein